jgi:hypothetical protein
VFDPILAAAERLDSALVDKHPRGPAPLERLAVLHAATSDFGTTYTGAQSIDDLKTALTNWDVRMKALADAYAAASPAWSASDQAGFVDWTNDWNALQARYNAAVSSANSAVQFASFSLMPGSTISAQTEYDVLAKAMRQCYPPDGCPTQKGDFDDLHNRITVAATAAGTPAPDYSKMVQPTTTDWDMKVFAATASVDPIATLTGQQKTPILGLWAPNAGAPSTSTMKSILEGALIAGGAIVGLKFGLLGGLLGGVLGFGATVVLSASNASGSPTGITPTPGIASTATGMAAKTLLGMKL